METDNLLAWSNESNITLNEEMSISLGILKTSLRNEIESREREIYSSTLQLTGILYNIKEMYTEDRVNNKKKRSLLPWGGDLLKSLFGTATESDLDGLRKQLRRISGNQNELVHVVENSLTMINKTNTFSKQNKQAFYHALGYIIHMYENIFTITFKYHLSQWSLQQTYEVFPLYPLVLVPRSHGSI